MESKIQLLLMIEKFIQLTAMQHEIILEMDIPEDELDKYNEAYHSVLDSIVNNLYTIEDNDAKKFIEKF